MKCSNCSTYFTFACVCNNIVNDFKTDILNICENELLYSRIPEPASHDNMHDFVLPIGKWTSFSSDIIPAIRLARLIADIKGYSDNVPVYGFIDHHGDTHGSLAKKTQDSENVLNVHVRPI